MSRPANTKVLIIDDQPLFCMGLVSMLEKLQKFNIVGITSNADEALKLVEKEKPRLVIMEIILSNDSSLELIKKIKLINTGISILILSSNNERFYSERALRLGARGYIMKTEDANTITEAIYTVLDGKIYLSETERDRIFQAMSEETSQGVKNWTMSLHKLSNRELQVFTMIGKGHGTIEIATRFKLSTKTIDTYKEHIKLKLHCASSQELRQLAIEWANNSSA